MAYDEFWTGKSGAPHRMSSFPANSASSVRDESQLQMAQGIVRAISSLNSRPDAMQAPTLCVLVTQLIKCTNLLFISKIVSLLPSLVRVAYLLCFNRYNTKYSR
ncbi:uncharacterized protein [Lolium perenne]|uniref:uncharacterized protein isoform X2 n=1 Tax=Lolium perenne TaxID=4522 RepID=UPI003A9A079F